MDAAQDPTQLPVSLHQIGFETRVGQGQGSRHTGQPPADDQPVRDDVLLVSGQGSKPARFGHRHAHQVLGFLRGRLRLVHVHPRALVADVGHLEQVRVQPRLADSLLEQRLVGTRRARGDDHPVQAVCFDFLLDPLLGVLRAGVEVALHVCYVGQRPDVVHHLRHVHHPADVEPAETDEHPDAWWLAPDVALRWVLLLLHQGAPGRGQQPADRRRRTAGLHHCLWDVLGRGERPADEDARPRGGQRRQGISLAEAVAIQLDPQPVGQLLRPWRGFKSHRQHDQVELLLDHPPVPWPDGQDRLGLVSEQQVVGVRILFDRGEHVPDISDAVLLLRPLYVLVEVLAVGPHIHVEDGRLDLGHVLLGDDRLLGGVHAANRGAVPPPTGRIPRAHALDEGDAGGDVAIRGALHLPLEGTRGREESLEFDAGHHVGVAPVAELRPHVARHRLQPERQHHRPHLQFDDFFLHVVVNAVLLAGVDALQALGADAAGQATGRLLLCLLVRVARRHLLEGRKPLLDRELVHRHAGLDTYLSPRHPLLDLCPRQVRHRQFGAGRWLQFLSPQIAMDGLSNPMASSDGVNDERRSSGGVARRKDPRPSRDQGIGINNYGRPLRDLDARALRNEGQAGPLPHGENDVVARHKVLRSRNWDRAAPARLIGQPLLRAHAFHPCHTPAPISHDLNGCHLPMEDDALFLRVAHLLLVGRRLLAGTAVVDAHLRPQPRSSTGHVHRHVPGPDDRNLLP